MKMALLKEFLMMREFFAGFLRTRHFARHFRRRHLLDALTQKGVAREMPSGMAQILLKFATANIDEVFQRLGSLRSGLSETEAEAIRARSGPNEIDHEKPLPWRDHLWHCYRNPFNLLLTLLAALSLLTGDTKATTVIAAMVILATLLRFWQENKSNKAADALKAMVGNTAAVLRRRETETGDAPGKAGVKPIANGLESQRVELPVRLLVPGDTIILSAGDMIPADCRVLNAKDLFVAQAAITGESMPVEKFVVPHNAEADSPLDLENIAFMGTNVVSGSATALVLATGNGTYFGALASRVATTDRTPTSFQADLNKVSWMLIRFMFVMAPLVLFLNGFTKGNWTEAVLFALSIAVGLTPEMLPLVATSTLAKGAVFLSRKKVIVKRLDAIQNLGAMDVLCTDKTGTLTQDKIFLTRHIDVWGDSCDDVLTLAYFNSHYQTGLKNLLDVAVLEHIESHPELLPSGTHRKIDEIPFDFGRRRMSVIVEHNGSHRLIAKGAVEETLSICTQVRHGDVVEPMTPDLMARLRKVTANLNEEGLRVIAVAARDMVQPQPAYGVGDEADLVLMGYIAFLDPPKDSTAPALKALAEHGVAVKVLTGDNALVTLKICQEVGLEVNGLLRGNEIEPMSDAELAVAVETNTVFAKLTPIHKERIVRLLRANGHTVGFMGDGINDAPALHAADVGISVDTAVDIAKEAADVILLEKGLTVVDEGVLEGRRTFVNMLKYIRMTASSNFGNVFSVLIAAAFIPFLPMLPMHLLIQNLLYDVSQTSIPFDSVDKEQLVKPQRWRSGDLLRFMVLFGPASSVFDILTFLMMWHVFGANAPEKQTLFQSGWFVVGLLTQTLVIYMIRTPKIAFLQSRPAMPVVATTCAIVVLGLCLPMGPLASYFKMQALPPLYFACLAAIVLAYFGLTQAVKTFYIRHWGWQ